MIADAICRLLGHKWEYTSHFINAATMHVQTDKVCRRCGVRRCAFTGPSMNMMMEAMEDE